MARSNGKGQSAAKVYPLQRFVFHVSVLQEHGENRQPSTAVGTGVGSSLGFDLKGRGFLEFFWGLLYN